jgi:hypothetical protein
MILLSLMLATFAQANFWDFEDYTERDWAALESLYIEQRVESGKELRAKVRAFARKNGGLKEMEEWSEDGLQNAPTNIDFSTHSGLDCLAATYWDEIKCIKL